MARKRQISDSLTEYGSSIRVERGLPASRDAEPEFFIYRRVDVTDDPDTTAEHRWDEVYRYKDEDAAHERAAALAEQEG